MKLRLFVDAGLRKTTLSSKLRSPFWLEKICIIITMLFLHCLSYEGTQYQMSPSLIGQNSSFISYETAIHMTVVLIIFKHFKHQNYKH